MTTLFLIFLLLPLIALAVSFFLKEHLHASGRIFLLHSVKPSYSEISSVSPDQLREFLDLVDDADLQFASLDQALVDPGKVAVTFDDGYDDFMEVWPLLRDRGVPVTIFIPTDFIGQANSWDNFLTSGKRIHLSADKLGLLSQEGVTFGSHGRSHRDLTTLTTEEINEELVASRKVLAELTGQRIDYIAWPFGKHDPQIARLAVETGYVCGFCSEPKGRGGFTCGRIPLGRLDNSISFAAKLSPELLSGAEYLKCLLIGAFSHLTPAVRHLKLVRTASDKP